MRTTISRHSASAALGGFSAMFSLLAIAQGRPVIAIPERRPSLFVVKVRACSPSAHAAVPDQRSPADPRTRPDGRAHQVTVPRADSPEGARHNYVQPVGRSPGSSHGDHGPGPRRVDRNAYAAVCAVVIARVIARCPLARHAVGCGDRVRRARGNPDALGPPKTDPS